MNQPRTWKSYNFAAKYYANWRKLTDQIKEGESDSEEWKYYLDHKDDSREELSKTLDKLEALLSFYPHSKWHRQCSMKHVICDYILREKGGLDDPDWFIKYNNGEDLKPQIPNPNDKSDHL